MSVYVVQGDDPQSVTRRRLLQALAGREPRLPEVRAFGETTSGPVTREYMERLGSPLSQERVFKPADVAHALFLAERLGIEGPLYCTSEVLRMQEELGRVPAASRPVEAGR